MEQFQGPFQSGLSMGTMMLHTFGRHVERLGQSMRISGGKVNSFMKETKSELKQKQKADKAQANADKKRGGFAMRQVLAAALRRGRKALGTKQQKKADKAQDKADKQSDRVAPQ